ncbi:MAG: 3'(2'),5'-bisphosphate nucleotidase CysQ, partial [Thiotrichaceae bacterium]|nr:3'(2'),5'-bisphosphate nucleotidase CysQ [Thiotrichaceae bacterium]
MVSIEKLISISKAAGDIILEFYQQQNYTQQSKSDHTPVTTADIKANEYIVNSLTTLYPDIPIIAEESELPCFEERKKWSDFFLVDPLDGTKEFIKRNGEFTVNIAYRSADGKSLGVVW